jgi:prevent-host-death family protein
MIRKFWSKEESTVETVSIYEAKTRFSELIDKVSKGTSVTITKHGRPVARLTVSEEARQSRELGFMSLPELPDSFFEPLSDDELELWGA